MRPRSAVFFRSLRNTSIAVTEVRSDNPEHGTSAPQIREDAFVVALQLVDYPVHEWFEDERAAPVTSLRAGDTTIYDMNRNPQFTINNPFHSVHFYFSRAALNLRPDALAFGCRAVLRFCRPKPFHQSLRSPDRYQSRCLAPEPRLRANPFISCFVLETGNRCKVPTILIAGKHCI